MLLGWLSDSCNSSLLLQLVIAAIGMVLCIQIMIISEEIGRMIDENDS